MFGLSDTLFIMCVAALGAIIKQVFGYLIAKEANPNMLFSWKYAQATFLYIAATAFIYTATSMPITCGNMIVVLLSGYGGQSALTTGFKIAPTPAKFCKVEKE